ncbi:MAG: phosphate acetyltransferase [Fermentimonas sp.]
MGNQRFTTMDLLDKMVDKAKKNKQRIVLPEGTEKRTLEAADRLLNDGVAELILLGDKEEIISKSKEMGLANINKATLVDPTNHDKKDIYKNLLLELRKRKGMTPEQADKLVENNLYLACLMIKNGDADGEVAGAHNTTGDVLRPALQIIKTMPGVKVVSGAFLMFTKTPQYGDNGTLLFADCAVMPNPNAEELASIAVSSAQTMESLAGIEPRVAMLSFSTKGSASHEMVDKVSQATSIAKELSPNLIIDGELQADAAIVPEINEKKAPGSPLAGKANVLVFPTLEAGNIGYKLVQRLGNAEAIGPILQGMAAPVNDLSRGCSVEDIYNMVTITANQAIGLKSGK